MRSVSQVASQCRHCRRRRRVRGWAPMRALTTTARRPRRRRGRGVLGYASLVERNAFVLRRFEVPVLPAGRAPLRVLHLSDLHLLPRPAPQGRVGARAGVARARPRHQHRRQHRRTTMPCPRVLDAFGPLLERPGVFVLGSNDYFAPKLKNPLRYLTPRPRRRRPAATPGCPPRTSSRASRRRLGRPDQPRATARRGRARRSSSSASTTRTWSYDRLRRGGRAGRPRRPR